MDIARSRRMRNLTVLEEIFMESIGRVWQFVAAVLFPFAVARYPDPVLTGLCGTAALIGIGCNLKPRGPAAQHAAIIPGVHRPLSTTVALLRTASHQSIYQVLTTGK